MAQDRGQSLILARRLRSLRESSSSNLTQGELGAALGQGKSVPAGTVSSWESLTLPKTPPAVRLTAYARFFCTPRSLEGKPHLVPEGELTIEERDRFLELEAELLELADERRTPRRFKFDSGPVVVICPTAPKELSGPLADEEDPNFTKLHQYGDLDSLVELWGHLRAENPTLDVVHRIATEVVSDDISSHLILIGGVGWNKVTRRIQNAISNIPVTQIEVDDLKTGEIFELDESLGGQRFYPEYQTWGEEIELIADVGYLVRRRSPYQMDRTLTICNGIHSRGVYGAVRALTDTRVREENERYLADRFPGGEFAVLLRVPVVTGGTLSPDLRNPDTRLFEWDPTQPIKEQN